MSLGTVAQSIEEEGYWSDQVPNKMGNTNVKEVSDMHKTIQNVCKIPLFINMAFILRCIVKYDAGQPSLIEF